MNNIVNVKPVIVADAPEAHQVWLDIGVQHFTVGDYCETKEEADWHANQLRHALLSASPGERDGVLDRDKVMASANMFAAAYSLVEIVDGHRGANDRWTNGRGMRLKDTSEWCVFYSAVKSFQNRGEVKDQAIAGESK